MTDAKLVFNGIDGTTGEYLLQPMTAHQVSRLAQEYGIDDAQRQELAARSQGLEPSLGVKEGVDPNDLAQTGWGAIFPDGFDPAVKDALGELLAHRREQAGDRFRIFEGPDAYRPGESKDAFLRRHGMGPGPADPDRVPYYLLLVGDPEAIPYGFQYQLDVQYAVGRVHFDTLEAYARYARSVVSSERGEALRSRTAVFFGTRNADDEATQISADDLVAPLAAKLGERFAAGTSPWQTTLIEPRDATKPRLLGLLGGEETPAFLFTASHGVGFALTDPRQPTHQGALLCQEWPGPGRGQIASDHYVAASDIGDDARLLGLIAFTFACYGAGTPRLDDFSHLAGGTEPAPIARRAFVAPLPRRLLTHPRGGALAVIGHVERAWGCSIRWADAGAQVEAFRSTLHRLMAGHRVGSALEPMNGRYAEISTDLGATLRKIKYGLRPNDLDLAWMWTAHNDARAYAVVGDPAVRLAVGEGGAAAVTGIEPVTVVATSVSPVGGPTDPPVAEATAIVSMPDVGGDLASMDVPAGSEGAPSIASVIEQVKRAVRLVERVAARPVGATIERVELTIQTVAERSAGGEVTLQVPFLGELGGGASTGSNHTQAVSLTLRPVEQIKAFDVGGDDVELRLTTAILDLRDAVRAVAASPPRFELEAAHIELRFAVTREGHVTLIAKGEHSDEVTHTLRLHIAGPSA